MKEEVEVKEMKERKDFEEWKEELWRKDSWVVFLVAAVVDRRGGGGCDEVGAVGKEMVKRWKGDMLVAGRFEGRKVGGGGGGGSARKWRW